MSENATGMLLLGLAVAGGGGFFLYDRLKKRDAAAIAGLDQKVAQEQQQINQLNTQLQAAQAKDAKDAADAKKYHDKATGIGAVGNAVGSVIGGIFKAIF